MGDRQRVELAVAEQPRRAAGRSSAWPPGASPAVAAEIVEDNELNMKLFHDLLEAHGYQTVGTRNGIEALDLARKHRPT